MSCRTPLRRRPPRVMPTRCRRMAGSMSPASCPTDPDAPSAPLRGGIEAQSDLCFENLRRILRHAGYTMADVVFVRIYLKEFDRDFAAFNGVYVRNVPQDRPLPSRTTVGVSALGRGALVEIDMVCFNAAKLVRRTVPCSSIWSSTRRSRSPPFSHAVETGRVRLPDRPDAGYARASRRPAGRDRSADPAGDDRTSPPSWRESGSASSTS